MILVIAAAGVALVVQIRHEKEQEAWNRAMAAAAAFANSPGVVQALESPDPTATLQPLTEKARRQAAVDFIVVASNNGVRYTQPDPNLIGTRVFGSISPATEGQPFKDKLPGNLGWQYRAMVPVLDADGKVIGLVLAGVGTEKVADSVNRQLPFLLGSAAAGLAVATFGVALVSKRLRRQTHGLEPAEMTRLYEHHDAVLHSVREGVLIVDRDQRLLLANDEAHRLLDLPPDAEGQHVSDIGLDPDMTELLASGRVALDEIYPAGEHLLGVNQRRTHWNERTLGTVTTLRDTTELRALAGQASIARERLKLLYDASIGVGSTLDVTRTAEELAMVAAPRFADFVAVDLSETVMQGEESTGGDANLRRMATAGTNRDFSLYSKGELVHFMASTPQALCLARAQSVLEPVLAQAPGWRAQDTGRAEKILDEGIHSLIVVPVQARGTIMGVASFYRSQRTDPFDEDDLSIAEEIVGRAAICIDNARRYTREHNTAVSLQRSLLPRGLPDQRAVEVAHRYLPAQAGVSGDWFDVIPLSGARVALVAGDVVGHGLHAAATMGRLRTAVHNFSALDLAPDELLTHLDDFVSRLNQEDDTAGVPGGGVVGATCLYAIYDPVTQCCTMANAGHPPPALVHPEGAVTFLAPAPGPPLGVGGHPFELLELEVPEGSRLVLYTDGLIDNPEHDLDAGIDRLHQALARSGRSPEETCDAVLGAVLPAQSADDIALLVARTRALDDQHVASWDVPPDRAVVAEMRVAVVERLTQWGLDEAVFATELIISELITNAIRYGGAPIQMRLLHDRTLICEVSDASSTSPHLRRAAITDEGGRGLFLVAQLTERWGTRYTARGKTIWAEQLLPTAGATML
ncbi:SpoIIE family protein phosphatase/ATP-binding protein [Streptomyces peucetius]|nr:histidine kinase [Streptomyces peucetius subsp. caesius ATCC 27952]